MNCLATLAAASTGVSCLPPPHASRNRPCFFIADGASRQVKRQLDLPLMVTLVPNHVLKKKDGVVVVKVHFLRGLSRISCGAALYCSGQAYWWGVFD